MVRTIPMRSPRYLLLADTLRREIAELQPNSRLPGERALQARFGVSRATVRRALAMLERGGLVTRQRRHGTAVSPPKIVRSLSPLYSIEEDLTRQGAKSEARLLSYEPAAPAPEFVQRALGLAPGATAGRLALLRLIDDRIIAYDRRYFPHAIAHRFDPVLLSARPITAIVGELAGSPIVSSESEIEIDASSAEVAETLRITPGSLTVTVTGTLYLESGAPVQLVVVSYRVDRVRFRSSMRYARPAGHWD
jgi:DNA-binding GntR family transcriptional regulator